MRRAVDWVYLDSHLRCLLSPPACALLLLAGVTRGGTPAPAPSRFDPLRFPAPAAGLSEPPRGAAAPGGGREAAAGAGERRVPGPPTAGPDRATRVRSPGRQ